MREKILLKANAMKETNDLMMKGEIVIFGSTYMAGFPFYDLINKCNLENAIYNRSIEGLTIEEADAILEDCVIALKPEKIFIALGEEDEKTKNAADKYCNLINRIRLLLPKSKIYVIGLVSNSAYAESFNKQISVLDDKKNIFYIELMSPNVSESKLYKHRFKILSCFFRKRPLTMTDAFAVADI